MGLDKLKRECQRKNRIDVFKLPCFIAVVFGLFVLMCWACNVLVDYYSEEGGSL